MMSTSVQWLLDQLNNENMPLVLLLLLAYTLLAEIVPRSVTRLNSNAYTSQVRWNITLPSLRFQLVNYLLYHQGLVSQVVHGITILIDSVLWSCYFHCLLRSNPLWAYSFVFFCTIIQALTYDDVKLKVALTLSYTVIFMISAYAYSLINIWIPETEMLKYISITLLVNGSLRALSHLFEPLPIDYLWLKNDKPIYNWVFKPEVWRGLGPLFGVGFLCGLFSELQAGTPIRLLSSFLVLFYSETVGVQVSETIQISELRNRARSIDTKGWKGDDDARVLFKICYSPRVPQAGEKLVGQQEVAAG